MFHVKHIVLPLPYSIAALLYGLAYTLGPSPWSGWVIPAVALLVAVAARLLGHAGLLTHATSAAMAVSAFAPLAVATEQALQLYRIYPDASHLMALSLAVLGSLSVAGTVVCASALLLRYMPVPSSIPLPMALMALSLPSALHHGAHALALAGAAAFALAALATAFTSVSRLAPYAVVVGAAAARWAALHTDPLLIFWTLTAAALSLSAESTLFLKRRGRAVL